MDDQITAYIANGQPWQRAALTQLRDAVRQAIPTAGESLQYGKPHYSVDGELVAALHLAKSKVSLLILDAHSIPAEKGFLRSLGDGSRKVVDVVEDQEVEVDRIVTTLRTARS
jgi:hypothetical protein